jgi:hypothetical protein
MRVVGCIVVLVALAASLVPRTADAKELYAFKVGQWAGRAWHNDRTGKFSHCSVRVRYRSGLRFSLSHFASGRYSIALQKPEWRLGKGQRYDVRILVDGKDLGQFQARALSDQLLGLFLPGNSPILQRLRWGSALTIRAAQKDFRFPLTDSAKALDRIKACVELGRRSASGGANNPFARDLGAAPGPAPGSAAAPAAPGDALGRRGSSGTRLQGFIATLLRNAGLQGFRFEPPGTRKSKNIVASWRAPGIYGLYMVVRHQGRSIEEVTGPFLARLGRSCKGRYGYAADVARRAGKYIVKKSSAACSSEGKSRFYVFATSVRSPHSIVVITHVARDRGEEEVRTVNTELEKVLTSMLGKL